jgi:hypothetical protein
MNHWDERRCEFAVMAAAGFFKGDSDSRSKTQFAKDNFEFCMKSYVDKFMTTLMTPVTALLDKQMDATSSSMDVLNSLRDLTQSLYSELSKYVEGFYRKFNASVFEVSRVVQYMRMAVSRVTAMMMSMLYTGITVFRGMLNSIQFVIKVILIICGIMIAIIIVLWFVLFPVIPLIISTLGAIVTTVALLSMVISSQIANQASSSKKGFCFAKDTLVPVNQADGKERLLPVQEVKVGDTLSQDGGRVTAVLVMDGTDVPLYRLEGILVSGSHLVKGTDSVWKSVCDDERSQPVTDTSATLYCFNTATHNIPVYSPATQATISFRDWEEFSDQDDLGHYSWNYLILKLLNNHSNYDKWKNSMTPSTEVPLMSGTTKVKTTKGYMELSRITLGTPHLVGRQGKSQKVVGKVHGELHGNKEQTSSTWATELFELDDTTWVKSSSTVVGGEEVLMGENVMTETGELVVWDEREKRDKVIRDFTDIGYTTIHETYPLVASRLRIYA